MDKAKMVKVAYKGLSLETNGKESVLLIENLQSTLATGSNDPVHSTQEMLLNLKSISECLSCKGCVEFNEENHYIRKGSINERILALYLEDEGAFKDDKST